MDNLSTFSLQKPDTDVGTRPLREYVNQAMDNYFSQLGDHVPANLYQMVMEEVEPELFRAVMNYTRNNQSRAAIVMGISRGTLRKKIKIYGLVGNKQPQEATG